MPFRPVLLDNQLWYKCEAFPAPLAKECRAWLTDSGSLTAKLKAQFPGSFQVDVLFQDWEQPTADECRFLAINEQEEANIREVMLICNGIPMVFARSILPAATLEGKNRELLDLRNRPLGEFIFSQPELERGPIEITRVPDLHGHTVWGRRSQFMLNHKPLAVCEYFLPALFAGYSKAVSMGASFE